MPLSELREITGTSPASASTAAVGDVLSGLQQFDELFIDAALVGATGGTLDVYIQRKLKTDVWADWAHFPQLASGAAAVKYSVPNGRGTTIVVVGGGTDATPAPALAANTFLGGHPGDILRCVCVAGASTSVGAAVAIRITGRAV
jgi:hypothetical protein